MKKIVLAPDSFKGTLSASYICAVMRKVISRFYPHAEINCIPIADGGEGTVETFLVATGGQSRTVTVSGPYGEEIPVNYAILPGKTTAVIEMAACAGLPLEGPNNDPSRTSTYGVGQLMCDAIEQGCQKLIVGIGGSATNDAGCGAAAACGMHFINASGSLFIPTGGTLGQVRNILSGDLRKRFLGTEIVVLCDVDNPFCGPDGAAFVFSPQKGATPEMARMLDVNMQELQQVIFRDTDVDVSKLPGAGAAGGFGGGLAAFWGAQLKPGIETVLDELDFSEKIKDADCVITGEGKFDSQSLRGKAVMGVARRAAAQKIPVYAIVGDVEEGIQQAYVDGLTAVLSTNRKAVPYSLARQSAPMDIARTTETLMRILYAAGK